MIKKIAVAAAFLLAGSATGWAGSLPVKFNVSLDGFCDVFKLHYAGFLVYGKHTGCGYNAIDGGTVATVNGTNLLITNDVVPHTKTPVQTWYFSPPATPGAPLGTWYLYISNGKSQVLLSQGTYTLLAPGAVSPRAGARPAADGR